MPRKKRIWYPGATYHVMSRGNRRGTLFKDTDDYLTFLEYVSKIKNKYPFKIHSICLMTNHFHILLETQDESLSLIMQKILHLHASEFNNKYHLSGHLYEGRFASSIVEDDVYFLEVSRYIHLNPVKAYMVRNPLDYEYSSYDLFVSNQKSDNPVNKLMDDLVDTSRVLNCFHGNKEQYRMFVEGKLSHAEQEMLIQKEMKEDEMWLPW